MMKSGRTVRLSLNSSRWPLAIADEDPPDMSKRGLSILAPVFAGPIGWLSLVLVTTYVIQRL